MKARNILLTLLLVVSLSFTFYSCSKEAPESHIPFVPVYTEINLNDLKHQDLHTKGWTYVDHAGIRGLIIHKATESSYYVFDRVCSFKPEDECAIVNMHSSGFYMVDDCCKSTFDLGGNPTSGPASHPLRRYQAVVSNGYLIISN